MSDIEQATRPLYYGRPFAPSGGFSRSTTHRCGNCAWQGTGSNSCPNNRVIEPVEEVEFDGVERDTDAWLEAADNYRDAEIDRQEGVSEW